MSSNPKPLLFHTTIEFNDKVPLAQRKIIVEQMKDIMEELIANDDDLYVVSHISIECPDTSQYLEINPE